MPSLLMPNSVLAFDPGGTTGFSYVRVINGVAQIEDAGQFETFMELPKLIPAYKHYCNEAAVPPIVLFESFAMLSSSTNPIALEVIGAIKVICQQWNIEPISKPPGYRKFICQRYPQLKSWAPKGNHSVSHWWDATQHALTLAYHELGARGFLPGNIDQVSTLIGQRP